MGEDRADQLYRQYGGAIFARCRALLRDEAEAEDATQETFVRVYRNLAQVPSEQEALWWIYRVATNYCLNEVRNRKRRPRPSDELPDTPASPLDSEDQATNRALVVGLVERAPEEVRSAAWLYFVDGFDQEEVASILGLSRRTVVTRLAKFTERTKKHLEREQA